ncbi:MAG: nucleotidyltransferase family protein [Cellulosilyticaceae bacterium]
MVEEIQKIRDVLKKRQQKKIEQILSILKSTSPLEIGVYGSVARGDYKATSDIDIYVLYKEVPVGREKGELYEAAEELGIDLLISEYNSFYSVESAFCKSVMKDKKILWEEEENECK